MIVDLTGKAITELLSFASITSIVGQKVRGEWAQGESPPGVLVRQLTTTYNLGSGTRRLGLQVPVMIALCYGTDRKQAAQVANAVVEAMNVRGSRTDASGRLVLASLVETGGDVELDPVTKWPHSDVVFRLIGAQVAVVVA